MCLKKKEILERYIRVVGITDEYCLTEYLNKNNKSMLKYVRRKRSVLLRIKSSV